MNKIEHIGIAVKDIEASNKIFTDVLGVAPYKSEEVESEGVITSFFQAGPNKIELLQATREDSAISKKTAKAFITSRSMFPIFMLKSND